MTKRKNMNPLILRVPNLVQAQTRVRVQVQVPKARQENAGRSGEKEPRKTKRSMQKGKIKARERKNLPKVHDV